MMKNNSKNIDLIVVSDDKTLINHSLVYEFLTNHSTWAKGISQQLVDKSIENSLCFGAYINKQQVGFCRVISDYTTFANLVDMFVLPEFRQKGISKQLMKAVIAHPDLQGLRRFTLATSDAHGVYEQFDFKPLKNPGSFMEIYRQNIYSNSTSVIKGK